MGRLREFAQTFTAVAAALAVCGSVAWWWLSPKIAAMVRESEARQGQQLALFASAVAAGDTTTLRVFSVYGVPVGPAGR